MIPHLSAMLGGENLPLAAAKWLRSSYFPEVSNRFNHSEARKRIALYKGDRIPDNERNLTDVRNRVSLVVEYELARIANQILDEAKNSDLYWCYVVANRFPDLGIRRKDGTRGLRFEVKCLQSIAEEKSANFDTLIKDINALTDFLVVLLWEWDYDPSDFTWERAPKILRAFVFHALSIAQLRDTYWLNRPPHDLGNGLQGFDLRFAINCKSSVYAREEGNYGKLLRIWQRDFPFRPVDTEILLDTEREYLSFKDEALMSGFRSLGKYFLPRLSRESTISPIRDDAIEVGMRAGEFAFFLGSRTTRAAMVKDMSAYKIQFAVELGDKYTCKGYRRKGTNLEILFRDRKPKTLCRSLFGLGEN